MVNRWSKTLQCCTHCLIDKSIGETVLFLSVMSVDRINVFYSSWQSDGWVTGIDPQCYQPLQIQTRTFWDIGQQELYLFPLSIDYHVMKISYCSHFVVCNNQNCVSLSVYCSSEYKSKSHNCLAWFITDSHAELLVMSGYLSDYYWDYHLFSFVVLTFCCWAKDEGKVHWQWFY